MTSHSLHATKKPNIPGSSLLTFRGLFVEVEVVVVVVVVVIYIYIYIYISLFEAILRGPLVRGAAGHVRLAPQTSGRIVRHEKTSKQRCNQQSTKIYIYIYIYVIPLSLYIYIYIYIHTHMYTQHIQIHI